MVSEMEVMERRCNRLRNALFRLVGTSTKDELMEMEAVMVLVPVPANEKQTMLEAIHALLAEIEHMELPKREE